MSRTELIIQLVKIVIGLAFGVVERGSVEKTATAIEPANPPNRSCHTRHEAAVAAGHLTRMIANSATTAEGRETLGGGGAPRVTRETHSAMGRVLCTFSETNNARALSLF
jgi:hypothetical protein